MYEMWNAERNIPYIFESEANLNFVKMCKM